MKTIVSKHGTGERVMRGEFDQIAHNLAIRIAQQREQVERRAAAHRSTRLEKHKLAALAKALDRIDALRSRLA